MAYKGGRLSSGREVMPVSVYEALSAMLQFGLWILALITLIITLLMYLNKHKQTALGQRMRLFMLQKAFRP
ncbi:putative holin-like toxin [Paenibacillus alvei]|uniref:Holin-like toxin n=2 Tax=Paenibacillus alvei TaxID=44250 RepID=A0AAP6ZS77_PAEAL|nr:putative holin-like toxin [Paenibacillus alvei]